MAQQDRELDPPETLTRQPTTFSLPGAGKERAGLTRRVLKAGRGTIIAAVVFLALIQVASLFFPPYIFPGLPLIAQALVEVLTDEADHILRTVARFGIALALAIAMGWFIGLTMGAFRRFFGESVMPALNIVQAVPALSWVLVSVLWISSIELRVGFICFIIGMPFFAISVYEGLRDIDADLVKAIDQFRPTRWQVLRMLLFPQSLVYLLLSVRTAASLCLRILVFAEMIGATSGMGERMGAALANFRMDRIFAWTIVLIFVNFAVSWLTGLAERWLLRWREEVVVR